MEDRFNLKRFLDAQSNTYERALTEIKNGKKEEPLDVVYFSYSTKVSAKAAPLVKYAIKSRRGGQ